MNCLINQTVDRYLQKGKKVEVIARYLRLKYKMSIEIAVLLRRVEALKVNA